MPGHRQKPLKDKAGGILPRNRQRGDTGAGARHRHHADSPVQRVLYDLFAGIADAGHPSIGAKGTVLPGLNAGQDGLSVVQRVLVIADHRLFEPQIVEQPQCHAGVLRRHKVHRAEGGRHPRRHILQIADGRSYDIKCPRHGPSSPVCRYGFIIPLPAGFGKAEKREEVFLSSCAHIANECFKIANKILDKPGRDWYTHHMARAL